MYVGVLTLGALCVCLRDYYTSLVCIQEILPYSHEENTLGLRYDLDKSVIQDCHQRLL